MDTYYNNSHRDVIRLTFQVLTTFFSFFVGYLFFVFFFQQGCPLVALKPTFYDPESKIKGRKYLYSCVSPRPPGKECNYMYLADYNFHMTGFYIRYPTDSISNFWF